MKKDVSACEHSTCLFIGEIEIFRIKLWHFVVYTHTIGFLRNLESVRKGVTFPQQADLNSATEGLLRVQDAYDLDVFSVRIFVISFLFSWIYWVLCIQFANGDFEGLSTNSSLNAADCFIIGSYSLSANIFTRAIEWLERAYHLVHNEPDTSISSQTVWKQLKDAVSRVRRISRDLID